jgi:hypothetical protein
MGEGEVLLLFHVGEYLLRFPAPRDQTCDLRTILRVIAVEQPRKQISDCCCCSTDEDSLDGTAQPSCSDDPPFQGSEDRKGDQGNDD